MKKYLISSTFGLGLVAVFSLSTAVAAPIVMTDAQMDMVIAGDLKLPNDKVIFEGVDNPAPGPLHPSFGRSGTASGVNGGNEGPWSAAKSPVIDAVF